MKLSRQINKQGDEVTQYVESVDDKDLEKKSIENEIQTCEEKEDKRKRELQACRVQLEDILDERDHLPVNPEGFDPQEEKTLSVCINHYLLLLWSSCVLPDNAKASAWIVHGLNCAYQ